jgi:DNA-binding transcriptional regulator YiaG
MSKVKTKLRCECGGELREVELATFDLTPYAGLPVRIRRAPGYRCDECGAETLAGYVINEVLRGLALAILEQRDRLSGEHTRYLRRFLRLKQAELADRMGVNRVTVAKWESGADAISPAHDLVLRALVVATLAEQLPSDQQLNSDQTAAILGYVRTKVRANTRRLPPIDVAGRFKVKRRRQRARAGGARRAGA